MQYHDVVAVAPWCYGEFTHKNNAFSNQIKAI